MRIDKFLNTINLIKRRKIAQDMIEHQLIKINNITAKSSKFVKVGDIIEIQFLEYTKKYKILKLPEIKNIPKNTKNIYIEELS
ncbi:RNA-binding S4 domain-containing protein [Helicobacter sp. MIT 14-3879]|uniref:RNA-binding S4 domain-containing protein n=1 Tax=Helicobacter sp. MIT 14-3879 TaxID=2040649 RepID=UPI000E1E6031|nr:RNA-binding S4 domain-containing protein [Helicobacter sp. MIT 14-3879]RDU65428.1 hypothetical protein CQA44_00085 [Helicobacter sp. MIT 14-3879]